MYDKLKTLYEQMERELHYLKPAEKEQVKKYMIFAFERGEKNVIDKIKLMKD